MKSEHFPGGTMALRFVPMTEEGIEILRWNIAKKLESSKNFSLDQGFRFVATLLLMPGGGGATRRGLRDQLTRGEIDHLLVKKAIFKLPDNIPAGLCLPASLAAGILFSDSSRRRDVSTKKILAIANKLLADIGYQTPTNKQILLGVETFDQLVQLPELNFFTISCFLINGTRFFIRHAGPRNIHLLLVENHYYVICCITTFLRCRNYCENCGLGNHCAKSDAHKCTNAKCMLCHNPRCRNLTKRSDFNDSTYCKKCDIRFPTIDCHSAHICGIRRKCKTCSKIVRIHDFDGDIHKKCGQHYCRTCRKYVGNEDHQFCFVSPYKFKIHEFVSQDAWVRKFKSPLLEICYEFLVFNQFRINHHWPTETLEKQRKV